jgi:hypothetical protein
VRKIGAGCLGERCGCLRGTLAARQSRGEFDSYGALACPRVGPASAHRRARAIDVAAPGVGPHSARPPFLSPYDIPLWPRKRDIPRDVDREIENHLELRAREFEAQGMSPSRPVGPHWQHSEIDR